jgi:CheY-like chemotaxis protein
LGLTNLLAQAATQQAAAAEDFVVPQQGGHIFMVRPCFLVIDPEFPGSISTRKLVIETAKFNVLTAYSGREAIETLRLYPALDGAVLDESIRDIACQDVVTALKAIKPAIPIIAIASPRADHCPGADYHLESFDPRKLLEILTALQPEAAKRIEKRNEELENTKKPDA